MMVERLYTPWRLKYITSTKKKSTCVFCDAVQADPILDPETYTLHRGENTFSIMNIYPYNVGHLMVLPNRHVANLVEASPSEQCEMMRMAAYYSELLGNLLNPDGFNIGFNLGDVAGAGLGSHLHLHIVPRWVGDSNFMPVLGETRILPEELGDTYDRIRKAMDTFPPPKLDFG